MENKQNRVLRIYISSTDKTGTELLYEHIIYKAKDQGMAGATVLKGIMGFGASSAVYSVKLWEITEKLPVIVELIDEIPKIEKFYPDLIAILEKSGKGCLVTSQDLDVVFYKPGKSSLFKK
jgi:PII-like signaling protein